MNYLEAVPVDTIVLGYLLICEICLVYVNYIARVRYPEYFYETGKIWRTLDRKNAPISVFLHFPAIMVPALIAYQLRWTEALTLILGVVATNFAIDFRTVSIKMICIHKYTRGEWCNLEVVKDCMSCIAESAEKYKVGFPSLKVKERSKK